MLFSELYKIIVNKVTFLGFSGAPAPVGIQWIRPCATFTEQVDPIHNCITLFWIPSKSRTKTVIKKLTKKPVVKLSDYTPITYLFCSLCNCTVRKCHQLTPTEAPVLLMTPNSLLLCIDGRALLSAKSLIILSYFIFLAEACSIYRTARLCSMLFHPKQAR